jgi:hypothetical protein
MRRHYTKQHNISKDDPVYANLEEQTTDRLARYKNLMISPKRSGYEVVSRVLRANCVDELRKMPEFVRVADVEKLPEASPTVNISTLSARISPVPSVSPEKHPLHLHSGRDKALPVSPGELNPQSVMDKALPVSPGELSPQSVMDKALPELPEARGDPSPDYGNPAPIRISDISLSKKVQVGLRMDLDLMKLVYDLAEDIKENLVISDYGKEEVGRQYFALLHDMVMPLVDCETTLRNSDQCMTYIRASARADRD